MRPRPSTLFLLILLLGVILFGCRKEEPSSTIPASPTAYLGVFAGGSESGILTLIVGPSMRDTVTGTFQLLSPSPSTIPLAGSVVNDTVLVRGGGYRIQGTTVGVRLSGTFNGPHGIGGFATQVSINNAGTTYCGNYTSQAAGENGMFNLVITGVTVSGISISATGQDLTQLEGSVVGNTITVPGLAAGAINGNTLSGTFTIGSNHGVWSATVCP